MIFFDFIHTSYINYPKRYWAPFNLFISKPNFRVPPWCLPLYHKRHSLALWYWRVSLLKMHIALLILSLMDYLNKLLKIHTYYKNVFHACPLNLQSYSKLKEALRVCAAFRGTYLDYRDKAHEINEKNIQDHADKMIQRPQGPYILFSTRMYGANAYQPRYGTQVNFSKFWNPRLNPL